MRIVLVILVALVLFAGLGYWVLASVPNPRGFDVQLDDTRELPQGGYYVGNYPKVEHLNPFTATRQMALSMVLRFTHDCLMHLDEETKKLEPAVARVVEASPDGLSYVFELRDDVRFSNGDPVSVDDVQFTYDVVRDENVTAGSIFDAVGQVARFARRGDRRFELVLGQPQFNGLAGVAIGYRVVQKRWFEQQIADAAKRAGQPVPRGPGQPGFGTLLNELELPGPGTGPYQIARDREGRLVWVKNQELWMVQNPHSWHRSAYPRRWNLEGIGLKFLTDRQAIFTQFKQQQLDWYMPLDAEELLAAHPDLREHYSVFRYDTPTLGHHYIGWNCDLLPDPAVRRALGLLFDRTSIAENVLGGSAEVSRSWFRATDLEHPEDREPLPFDPQAARAVLAAAGLPPIRLLAADSEQNRRILDLAISAFEAAGVALDAKIVEATALAEEREKTRSFHGILEYWRHSPLAIDPHEKFHSTGVANFMHYRDQATDALLDRARTTLDAAARAEIYRAFDARIWVDQPVTLLVHPLNTLLLHNRFRDTEPTWAGAVPARWWVPKHRRIHHPGDRR